MYFDLPEIGVDPLKRMNVFNLIVPNYDLYEDGTFSFSLRNGVMIPAIPNTTIVRVTPLDVLISTYGNLPDPLTFGIKKPLDVSWITNSDPALAYIDFTNPEGGSIQYVHIRIGTFWAETYINAYWEP